MSVVIIGGHDCVVSQYKEIRKNHKCKAEVLTQMSVSLDKQISSLDPLVLSTSTVSHRMIHCALDEVGDGTEIVRCHTNSGTVLIEILEEKCAIYAL